MKLRKFLVLLSASIFTEKLPLSSFLSALVCHTIIFHCGTTNTVKVVTSSTSRSKDLLDAVIFQISERYPETS